MQTHIYRCTASAPHPKAGQFVTKAFHDAHSDICVAEPMERDTKHELAIDHFDHLHKQYKRAMAEGDTTEAREWLIEMKSVIDHAIAACEGLEVPKDKVPVYDHPNKGKRAARAK